MFKNSFKIFSKQVLRTSSLVVRSVSKESACNAGDLGSVPGSGISSGEGNGNPFQYSCLENPMDRAWQATVYGIAGIRHDLATTPPPVPCTVLSVGIKRERLNIPETGKISPGSPIALLRPWVFCASSSSQQPANSKVVAGDCPLLSSYPPALFAACPLPQEGETAAEFCQLFFFFFLSPCSLKRN